MGRKARVVIPGTPHHVTQRGNRRQPTFFDDSDYLAYLQIAAEVAGGEDRPGPGRAPPRPPPLKAPEVA